MSGHVLTVTDTHLKMLNIISQAGSGKEDPPGQQTDKHPHQCPPLHSDLLLSKVDKMTREIVCAALQCSAVLRDAAESALGES